MPYNLKSFYAAARLEFGAFNTQQVQAMDALIRQFAGSDSRHLAYILATAWHETQRFIYMHEVGGPTYFKNMYDMNGSRPHVAKQLGNNQPGDGARYYGRGFVQLTGRANYERAGKALGIDLINQPARAADFDVAAKVLYLGMKDGWFTGKRLSHYFNQTVDDPNGARRIVNGTDKAASIAAYHYKFLGALKAAEVTQEVTPTPEPSKPGLFARLWKWMKA